MQATDLIFLFCFVPITVLLSFLEASTEYKNFILIISSVIFFSWGKPFVVCVMFATVLIDWLLGLAAGSQKRKAVRLAAVLADLALNVSLFLLLCHNGIFDGIGALSLKESLIPVGAAYYTIRGFSYVFDCFTGRAKAEKNPCYIIAYTVSYPLMLPSPIVRYGDMAPQLRQRKMTGGMISHGFDKAVPGLAKLTIAVPAMEAVASAGLGGDTALGGWLGMLAYICRVCLWWSGMFDISIGLGSIFGFTYPESFEKFDPMGLVSGLAESFNRTLNRFAAEVLTAPVKKRSGIPCVIASAVCCVIVASFYSFGKFVLLAGGLAALLVAAEQLLLKKLFGGESLSVKIFSCIYTCAASFAIFALTYFNSFSQLAAWLKSLLGMGAGGFADAALKTALTDWLFVIAVTAVCLFPPTRGLLVREAEKLLGRSAAGYGVVRIAKTVIMCLLLILSAAALVSTAITV